MKIFAQIINLINKIIPKIKIDIVYDAHPLTRHANQ